MTGKNPEQSGYREIKGTNDLDDIILNKETLKIRCQLEKKQNKTTNQQQPGNG